MRRPRKDKGFVSPEGWKIVEAERHTGRHWRIRRHRSLLWLLRLGIALLVLAAATPYLHDDDLGGSLNKLFSYRLAAPIEPGDRNGMLHK